MALPAHATPLERAWHYVFRCICAAILFFLIMPVVIILPLSFNAEPYFTFTAGMLSFESTAYSLRWYLDILTNGMTAPDDNQFSWAWWQDSWNNAQWLHSMRNSFYFAVCSTIIAAALGTIAALGLSRPEMPARNLIMGLMISPMVVPLVITATGMFFFYSYIDLAQTDLGIILAHATLGTPFVIITVTATLVGFDRSLIRAAQNLGAKPHTVFFKIILPLILPGVISGALFAFVTSFDEVVAIIFLADFDQRTIPRQMWSGMREQISPTILAVATILVLLSVLLLVVVELLRRRSERLRGVSPR